MASRAQPTAMPADGVERAAALLTEEHRSAGEGWPADAYLDLLSEDTNPGDAATAGLTQRLMNTSFVPTVYERWWRPALARVAKGATGPGMAEEAKIARLLLGLASGHKVLDLSLIHI